MLLSDAALLLNLLQCRAPRVREHDSSRFASQTNLWLLLAAHTSLSDEEDDEVGHGAHGVAHGLVHGDGAHEEEKHGALTLLYLPRRGLAFADIFLILSQS